MEAADAIARVVDHIRSRNIDYPTSGLRADKFAGGWSVYAPVEIDTDDPMAFLDMPVGRSVFLVGGSGRIDEVNSSVPPEVARQQFTERETAVGDHSQTSSGDAEAISREASRLIEPIVQQLALQGPPVGNISQHCSRLPAKRRLPSCDFLPPTDPPLCLYRHPSPNSPSSIGRLRRSYPPALGGECCWR